MSADAGLTATVRVVVILLSPLPARLAGHSADKSTGAPFAHASSSVFGAPAAESIMILVSTESILMSIALASAELSLVSTAVAVGGLAATAEIPLVIRCGKPGTFLLPSNNRKQVKT